MSKRPLALHLRNAPMIALVPFLGLVLTLMAMVITAGASHAGGKDHGARAFQHTGGPDTGAIRRAINRTLTLTSDDDDAAFLGSATLWGDGQHAVTSAHVVKGRQTVQLRNPVGRVVSGRVTLRDDHRDIAVISLPEAVFGPGFALPDATPQTGDAVYAIGAPLGVAFSVTHGIVSMSERHVIPSIPVRMIQHDAAINPGSSGGPLVDGNGRLLGINARIADGSRLFAGIAYAVPAALIARLVAGDLAPVPQLGMTLRPITPAIARALNRSNEHGVLVDDVTAGGRAWQAGILAGDVIVTLAGHPLRSPGDVSLVIDAQQSDQIRVVIARDGSTFAAILSLRAPLPSRPELGTAPQTFARIDRYTWDSLGIRFDPTGETVTQVSQSSPAYHAGLANGDRVLALNGSAPGPDGLLGAVITGPLVLLVQRGANSAGNGGRTLHIIVNPWSNTRPNVPVGGANALDPAVSLF